MSTAHRPTWDPAQAKDVKGGSRQFSVRDMAAHTKLKFRQPGQTSTSDIQKRDLRAELLAAEEEARNRKRKADGKAPLIAEADEEVMKRRKLLQQALDLDKDDDEDAASGDEKQKQLTEQDDTDGAPNPEGSSKGRDLDNDDDDDDDDEDDDDDGTAELLRELDKIKRERAEEKARQDAEQSAEREAEIASANPLLNLAAALGQQTPRGVNTTVPGTFAVKKRWDDDLIFKNQAMSSRDKASGQFVNDLLRTEFHKKFMAKFIK